MVSIRQSVALLVCLVYVPNFSAAFFRRTGIHKRSGDDSGSKQSLSLKNKLRFVKNSLPESTVGVKDSTVVLECHVTGTSNPSIHWLKDGQRILQGDRHTIYEGESVDEEPSAYEKPEFGYSETKSRLYIDCLNRKDAGEYTCVAENPTLRISQTTYLNVEKGDRLLYYLVKTCHSRSSRKHAPARVYMWTNSKLEYEGTTVELYCRAQGHPAPTVTWFDGNNEPIADGGQYTVTSNGDLIIEDISWFENMGGYTCVAENAFGSDSVSTFVYPMSRE